MRVWGGEQKQTERKKFPCSHSCHGRTCICVCVPVVYTHILKYIYIDVYISYVQDCTHIVYMSETPLLSRDKWTLVYQKMGVSQLAAAGWPLLDCAASFHSHFRFGRSAYNVKPTSFRLRTLVTVGEQKLLTDGGSSVYTHRYIFKCLRGRNP